MASQVKTITNPLEKLALSTYHHPHRSSQLPVCLVIFAGHENRGLDLHGEEMACAYEDVQVYQIIATIS